MFDSVGTWEKGGGEKMCGGDLTFDQHFFSILTEISVKEFCKKFAI